MQQIEYSSELNTVKTRIKTPFWNASYHLGWNWKGAGLGLNHQIMNTVLNNHADLIVFVEYNGYNYKMRYDKIVEFMKTYNIDYRVKSGKVALKVLPWDWFEVIEDRS